MLRLPAPSLVVLIGPSGAGKSTWAASRFRPEQIVASDDLRAVVGESRFDQRASADAFEVLDLIVERRLRRGLLTVVDSTALEGHRRAAYLAAGARHGVAVHAVVFDTDPDVCRRRNRARDVAVPPKVITAQIAAYKATRATLISEGFAGVHVAGDETVHVIPVTMFPAPAAARRQREEPMSLRFGLQIPNFNWDGGPEALAGRLGAIAAAAEEAGFTSIWVMDHFLQIPQAGREWDPMLDSYTTLGFLAGQTRSARLGALVTGVTYRNVAHLGKILATLDVLSGGRAICGVGAAWFEREHGAYGWEFPAVAQRFARLEDALELLPLLWGPGSPAFAGRTTSVAEAMCYPRPLQERIPILIGGGGEKQTLRLVARHADACNLFGDPATVRHKLDVLAGHCRREERDLAAITVTHLSTALAGSDPDDLAARVEAAKPKSLSTDAYAARVNAATVDDHIGRFRELAEAGVHTAIVNLPDVGVDAVQRFAPIIDAFAGSPRPW